MAEDKQVRTQKRNDYISWEEYFMGIALLSAERSKDPERQVGACIVNKDKRIVGLGYNGLPDGCKDDEFPWGKGTGLNNKHLYVCHAELNAILNKYSADLKGCTMYVGLFPCCECAKMIIQSGIKHVVYFSDEKADRDEFKASKRMFEAVKVEHKKFETKRETITIDFTKTFK